MNKIGMNIYATEPLVRYEDPLDAEEDLILAHETKPGRVAAFDKLARKF